MKRYWYRVSGDYGPQGGQFIEFFVYASGWQRAKNLFASRVKRDYPVQWERMGFRNISTEKLS